MADYSAARLGLLGLLLAGVLPAALVAVGIGLGAARARGTLARADAAEVPVRTQLVAEGAPPAEPTGPAPAAASSAPAAASSALSIETMSEADAPPRATSPVSSAAKRSIVSLRSSQQGLAFTQVNASGRSLDEGTLFVSFLDATSTPLLVSRFRFSLRGRKDWVLPWPSGYDASNSPAVISFEFLRPPSSAREALTTTDVFRASSSGYVLESSQETTTP